MAKNCEELDILQIAVNAANTLASTLTADFIEKNIWHIVFGNLGINDTNIDNVISFIAQMWPNLKEGDKDKFASRVEYCQRHWGEVWVGVNQNLGRVETKKALWIAPLGRSTGPR